MKPIYKVAAAALASVLVLSNPMTAQTVDYGDDSYEFANDGECDDPRFIGGETGTNVNWQTVGMDKSDCEQAVADGGRYWYTDENIKQTVCSTQDFGNDSGDNADDNKCDDPRYFGPMSDEILLRDDLMADASDCERACRFGVLFSRPSK